MKPQIFSVCVGYTDFLQITLPTWLAWSNRIVVITTSRDEPTQRLCQFYGVPCRQTEVFYHDGCSFDKGMALRETLQLWLDSNEPSSDQWWLILDADIVLPAPRLDLVKLNPLHMYGIPRRYCETWQQWQQVRKTGRTDFLKLEFNGRISRQISGFFQLGNVGRWRQVCPELYCSHPTAALSDVHTSQKWGFDKQRFLPGMEAIHLGRNRVNWSGRCTPSFRTPA